MLKQLLFSFAIVLCTTIATTAQITSVGILGEATPVGWDVDTNLVQDPMNPDIWTISLELTTGPVKFRANDDWPINWGADTFPAGTGVQDGDNIPAVGGIYDITLNTATGDYSFVYTGEIIDSIGLIGTATTLGNFDVDVDLMQPNPELPQWTLETSLTAPGQVKFRAMNDWSINWGGDEFPSGIGVAGGDNLEVDLTSEYLVTFNTYTAEYNFEALTTVYNSVGIIGSATPGGTAEDTELTQNPSNPALWSANITFTDGTAKFRANGTDEVNWGGEDFPSGTATLDGPEIPITAGEYNVNFNSNTGEYSFDPPISIFSTIGIIGTGTGLGFDADIDMTQDPANPDQWSIQLRFGNGSIKFRADDDWTVNWGDDGFPTGTGVQDGPDIPTFEGDWQVDFNATTGVYSFTPVSIGIIGSATPDAWDSDQDMDCSTTVGNLWSINIELIEGEAKFRQDNDWPVNWGAETFPTGTGVQDGDNIPVPAGTYGVTLNTASGEYVFGDPLSAGEVLNPNFVSLFPNPTNSALTINISEERLQRDVTISVLDITGKVIRIQQFDTLINETIDVSNLNSGMYILHIANDNYLVGKRFTVTK